MEPARCCRDRPSAAFPAGVGWLTVAAQRVLLGFLSLVISQDIAVVSSTFCVPPCSRGFSCDTLSRCTESARVGAQRMLLWRWDLSKHFAEGWGGADCELAVDYTFHAVDDSIIAVAVAESDSVPQVVDKLRRNKRHTKHDTGWLTADSSCDDIPSSCVDHPSIGSFRPSGPVPSSLSLLVLCKNKNKRDPPCKLVHAPPTIELRNRATGATLRVTPTTAGGGSGGAWWERLHPAHLQKYLPSLSSFSSLSAADLPELSMPSFSKASRKRFLAGVRSGAFAVGQALRQRLPTPTFTPDYWRAQLRSATYAAWYVRTTAIDRARQVPVTDPPPHNWRPVSGQAWGRGTGLAAHPLSGVVTGMMMVTRAWRVWLNLAVCAPSA
jgi:hypothetical protein